MRKKFQLITKLSKGTNLFISLDFHFPELTPSSFQYCYLNVVNNPLLLYQLTNICCNTNTFAELCKARIQNSAFYTGNPFHKHPTKSSLQRISVFFFYFLNSEDLPNLCSLTLALTFFISWYVPRVVSSLWPRHSKIYSVESAFASEKFPLLTISLEPNGSCHFLPEN